MAKIPTNFGSGGSHLTPGGAAGSPSLAEALRDIADDLAAVKPAPITAADAGAAYGPAEQALLNALKAQINAIAVAPMKTTKG